MSANTSFIEVLAEQEHDQWIEWFQYMDKQLQTGFDKELTLINWRLKCVPYNQLSYQEQESDRKFARIVWDLFNKYYKIEPRNV